MSKKKLHRLGSVVIALHFFTLPLVWVISSHGNQSPEIDGDTWTGEQLMQEVARRHQPAPYVYEEQTLVLMDGTENRTVRKMRRFSRLEPNEPAKFLLILDHPEEIQGVALLALRQQNGQQKSMLYLPAFGHELKTTSQGAPDTLFLGTDFTINDLTAETEDPADFRYIRQENQTIDTTPFFVVTALPANQVIEQAYGYRMRRHFIKKDIFFIVRTDYYDRRGRFSKTQTRQDLKSIQGDMWRANMILMKNHKINHKTLIKIDRRIFSHNYVPAEFFTEAWLIKRRHLTQPPNPLVNSPASPWPVATQDANGRQTVDKGE